MAASAWAPIPILRGAQNGARGVPRGRAGLDPIATTAGVLDPSLAG
jgi:hypothetical protein